MPSLQAPVWLHWALGQCHDNQAAPDTAAVQSFNHQYKPSSWRSVMPRVYLFVAGCWWRVGGGKAHSNVATLCHGAALGSSHPHCFASDNYQLILESTGPGVERDCSTAAAPPCVRPSSWTRPRPSAGRRTIEHTTRRRDTDCCGYF